MSDDHGNKHPGRKADPSLPHDIPASSFARLCWVLADIMRTRSSTRKISLFSDYLRSLESDRDLALAVQFAAEGAFPAASGRRAAVGHRTVALTAAEFCNIDYDKVFRPCRTATGSASETIEKLMRNLPEAVARRRPAWLGLGDMSDGFERLAAASGRESKQQVLTDLWQQMTPRETRFMIRMLGQGSLRIGFDIRSMLPAIAGAFDADPGQVRRVHMLTGDIAGTALLARQGTLDTAGFRMFQPVAFMLASPLEEWSVSDPQSYIAEEKFDGMRIQAHVTPESARLYSRDLNDITGSFPDAAGQLRKAMGELSSPADHSLPRLDHQEAVLDGELCAFKDGRIQPFQHLQKRMGVKKPGKKLLGDHPVLFIAYDLLFLDGETVLDQPLDQRRVRLETFCAGTGIPCSRQHDLRSSEDIGRLFLMALEHGNEGLMLKRRESIYEYGQRNRSWLKVKQPAGSLDTVIMYAHAGSGRRGGTYSDFTLGIRVDEDERYEEQFIPIGKAYGGYTDQELKKLNRRIKELTVERFGPTLSLRPGIVVEVEFDDIQVNRRTKAGYTLRLPRFRSIRWDLSPADTDTLADVERMYRERVEGGGKAAPHENPVLLFKK